MIAVMGAAGNVGSKVAGQLLTADEEVRVLEHARDLSGLSARGAEIVRGDAKNVDELRALFKGVSAALVLLPENVADPSFIQNRVTISRAIRDALAAESVGHVVALSAVGAEHADAPGPPGGLYSFEQDLSELKATNLLVLRSAAYMDYLLAALPMIQAQKVNGSAIESDVRLPMVATIDVASVAAERLRKRDFKGHVVSLALGPEDVTMAEATRAIGRRLGIPDLPYIEFPPAGVKAALVQAGMSQQMAGLVVDMQLACNEGRLSAGAERTPESTMPTRLEDFLNEALSNDTVQKAEVIDETD